jgi:hypothetical protein
LLWWQKRVSDIGGHVGARATGSRGTTTIGISLLLAKEVALHLKRMVACLYGGKTNKHGRRDF